MKIVDCFWEIANIGRKTVEIGIEENDRFCPADFALPEEYAYIVVKVPSNRVDFNYGLSQLGFFLIETQLEISKTKKSFNYDDSLVRELLPHMTFRDIKTDSHLESVIRKIDVNMFSTDRISIDPDFSPEIGHRRYINWMKTEYSKGSSYFYEMFYDNTPVGFSMYRDKDGVWDGLLGGVYKDVEGLGLLTSCGHFLYSEANGKKLRMVKSNISANNTPVLGVFSHVGYKIKRVKYVFVKHI